MNTILIEKLTNSEVRRSLYHTKNTNILYCSINGFWGVGFSKYDAIVHSKLGGMNMIGKLWSKIRELFIIEIEKDRDPKDKKIKNRCVDCFKKDLTLVQFREEIREYKCNQCYE